MTPPTKRALLHLEGSKRSEGSSESDASTDDGPEGTEAHEESGDTITPSTSTEKVWCDSDDEDFHVDVVGDKRLRKLNIAELDEDKPDRLPKKRLLTVGQVERILKRRNVERAPSTSLSWVESVRRKRDLKMKSIRFEPDRDSFVDDVSISTDNLNQWDETIATSTKSITRSTKNVPQTLWNPGVLNYRFMGNANACAVHQSRITALGFRDDKILFTAGADKTLRLFSINEPKPKLIASMHIKDFPIISADWNENFSNIICLGEESSVLQMYDVESESIIPVHALSRKANNETFSSLKSGVNHLHDYFAVVGSHGRVYLVDNRTMSTSHCYGGSGTPATAVAFHPSKARIITGDQSGSLFEWDITSGRLFRKLNTQGSLSVTSLATTYSTTDGCGPQIAVGSSTGFVDLFDLDNTTTFPEAPRKSFAHLTTSIACLKFHQVQPVLLAASDRKADAVRMVHVGSSPSVYMNWPSPNHTLGRITSIDFSPKGNWCALGSHEGTVKLFHLGRNRV